MGMPIQSHGGDVPSGSPVARSGCDAKRAVKRQVVELVADEGAEVRSDLAVQAAAHVSVIVRTGLHPEDAGLDLRIVGVADVEDAVPDAPDGAGDGKADDIA